ncbi:MAG: RNA-binding domain protein [Xanthobacteraceae bacterium]|jgi:23S rRNA pseudouridine2605 synthase|nr:RNA-binding domain protein [Xanthobacteraceae bacterium]
MPKNPPSRKDHNRVPRAPRALEPAAPREAERVAKVIARAGLGSRREIEEWILAGRVAVNGEVLESPARTVTAEDAITVDGNPLPAKERTRLFMYHKPKGVVTTNYDPEGRPTLFEILPAGLPRLVSVGRLDLNTEGLILLTNDGGLSRVLELPETGWLRRYRVRAKGDITQDKLDALMEGVSVDGVHYGPIEAKLDRAQGANSWLTLALREGKNREVRNVLGSLGLEVNRLIRVSYGPFQLGEIPQGEVEEVRTRVLADQLGETLAAAAGADFEGPLFNHDEDEEAPKAKPRGPKARYAAAEGAEDRHRRRPIDVEPGEGRSVTAGVVADRKGRQVLVQRVRSTEAEKPSEERPARRPVRESERREAEREAARAPRAPRGRSEGGERTFRKRPSRSFEEAPGGEEERPVRARPARTPSRDRQLGGPRPSRPREDRAPRAEGEGTERPFRSRNDRPERAERAPRGDRPFRERTPRPEGDRPFRERGPRPDGDRPFRPRGPRPEGAGDERPPRRERPEGGRPFRGEGSDRPYSGRVKSEQHRGRPDRFEERGEGERPAQPFRERAPRPEGDRAPRGDRPFRERGPRPEGERSFRPRASRLEGDERPPRRERPEGERSFRPRDPRPEGDRSERPPRRERPEGERPFRSREDRPARSEGDRPARPFRGRTARPEGERSFGQREDRAPRGERPAGKSFDKRPGGKPSGGKPPGGRPFGGKPGGRAGGGKPFGGKPGGKPGGRPPRTPRS